MALLGGEVACSFVPRTDDGRPIVSQGVVFEVEDLVTWSAALVPLPFRGARLRRNGDRLSGALLFPSAGRYLFSVTGASSTDEPAGITLFIDGQASGTAFFRGATPGTVSFLADVERAGTLSLRWELTTDLGEGDTLLDSFRFARAGDLQTEPRPATEAAALLGGYRDLFAARGLGATTMDARIEGAFDRLFRGAPSEAIFHQFGANAHGALAVIDEPGYPEIRAEAMALALLVTVQLDRRAEFDALWNTLFSLASREPTAALAGSFARTLRSDGRMKDPSPSAEAEGDVATALFLASGRWGEREPPYDYAAQARRVLHSMRPLAEVAAGRRAGRSGPLARRALFTGSWQPRAFVTEANAGESEQPLTAPRFYLPAFYELWARYGAREDAAFWQQAVTVARDYLVRTSHPTTGLWPGLTNLDGQPVSLVADPGSGSFRRESWRVLFNLAVDAVWWAADQRETEVLNRVHAFFVRQGLATYGDAFTQNGRPTSRAHAPGLVAMNAAASTASSDAFGWRFVDELASLPFGLGRRPTSDALLQLLGLLQVSGRFRVWVPDMRVGEAAVRGAGGDETAPAHRQ